MNTTARVETTGKENRIHLSEEAAKELIAHGKSDWVSPREDIVEAKGAIRDLMNHEANLP